MATNDQTVFDPKLKEEPIFVDPTLLQQAERRCRQRVESDPENPAALRSLAEICRKQGNLGEAGSIYLRLFERDPQDQEAGYLSAILCGTEPVPSPTGMRPAPFVLIKNFLPQNFHDTILPFAVANHDRFVESRVGRHAEYKPDVRESLEYHGEWEGAQRFVDRLVRIPNLHARLYLEPFSALVSAVRVRAYQDGHFFRVHMDAEPGSPSASRAYNFVYFFHRVPRPYTGGELLLFDTDTEANTFTRSRFTRVAPEDNAIIIFPCVFFHSVIAVRCPSGAFADSRFIINGHVSRQPDTRAPGVDSQD